MLPARGHRRLHDKRPERRGGRRAEPDAERQERERQRPHVPGAGFPAVGILQFVADGDRAERARGLQELGAAAVVGSWAELEALLP